MSWKCKKIKCLDYDDVLKLILNDEIMFPIIYMGCEYMFKNNLKFLELIEISYNNYEMIVINLDLEESTDTLNKLLFWLETKERYEDCQVILNFKRTIT